MSDYTELIHDLRYCADRDRPDCSICGYESADKCKDRIKLDAAAAIEDLQRELSLAEIAADDNGRQVEALQAEVKRLEPKRGEWITIRLNNGGSYTGCSCCEAPIPTDTMLDYIPESESKYCYSCGAKMEVQG